MKILVVGGTRFIGPAVVGRLVQQGSAVTVLHRGTTEPDLGPGVDHLHDDRSSVAGHVEAVRPDVILDMAPVHAAHGEQVADAARRGDVARVVVISSMDVYRGYDVVLGRDHEVQPTPFTESGEVRRTRHPYRDRFPEDDPMHRYDKLDVEERVLDAPEFTGISLRLSVVFGEGDFQHRVGQYLYPMVDGEMRIEVSDAAADWRFQRAYRADVADAIALACIHPRADGVYNVGSTNRTEVEWIETIASVRGWDGTIDIVPDDSLPADRRMGAAGRQDLVGATDRIRDLGWSETVGIEAGVARTIPWELAHRPPPEGDG